MPFWSRDNPTGATDPDPDVTLHCSFCGKSQREVTKLIAGPEVYICNECITLCIDIIQEEVPWPDPLPSLDALVGDIRPHVVGLDTPVRQLAGVLRRHLHGGLEGDGGPIVLIVGPSGSGKTALCRALCAASPVPAHHSHANRVSATGYVGDDIENLLFELVDGAQREMALATRGLFVLEDLQHIASRQAPEGATKRDVVGTEVQRQLLRILDGLPVRTPSTWGSRHPEDPNHNLFRTAGLQIVLTMRLTDPPEAERDLREVLESRGFLPELLARIRLIVRLDRPDGAAMRAILEHKLLPDAEALVRDLGGTLNVNADLVDAIAQEAARNRDGAWRLHQRLAALVDKAIT